MPTELQTTEPRSLSCFASGDQFELVQRIAKVFSQSDFVPVQFKGNIGNCIIAINMARQIGAEPLMVMQNLYVVHGKPAWSSSFLIACVNSSGRFSPLEYETQGEGDERTCVAFARDRSGVIHYGAPVSIAMAKAEGWHGKNGSKWKTMPELMLRYRAATFFVRQFCPELTMGFPTQEEAIDVDVQVEEPKPLIEKIRERVKPTATVELKQDEGEHGEDLWDEIGKNPA